MTDLICDAKILHGVFLDDYNDKDELGVILFLVRGSFLKGLFIKMFTATKTKYAYFGVFTCLLPLRYWKSHDVRQKLKYM